MKEAGPPPRRVDAPDGEPQGDPRAPGHVEALFAEYVRSGDGRPDFDSFVRRHEPDADALRALHSLWLAGGGEGAGTSDSTATCDPLGDQLRELAGGAGALPADGIPGFQLLDVLGEGGFGRVYRAAQERPIRRIVAIKVVKLGMDTREVVARFEAERQALALMNHPAIARVYAAGATERGRPYFVMEYIQGEPITAYCEKHGLGLEERLRIFLTVCDAVHHAHEKAVIHRDLKPSNVLVTLEGGHPEPKVIDFGIAKAAGAELTERTLETRVGEVIGTPAYMSPEQADVSRTDVDTRSDIYSLGVLLYELLVRAPPFERAEFRQKSVESIAAFLREADPPRPSARLAALAIANDGLGAGQRRTLQVEARQLRGDLDWIILKAMAKDREARYRSVSELAADIRRHLQHEPVLAGPPRVSYRLRKHLRKHRTAWCVAAALLVVALGVSGVFIYRAERTYQANLAAAFDAVADARLEDAKNSLAWLLQGHYGRRDVRSLERAVAELEARLRSEDSARQLQSALEDWKKQVAARDEAARLEEAWQEARAQAPSYAPESARGEEFEIHDRLQAAQRSMQDYYDSALSSFQRAVELAPRGSAAETAARAAFAGSYLGMRSVAEGTGGVSFGAEFFLRRAEEVDPTIVPRRDGLLRVTTQPPGAEVYCFRYAEHEKRLLPLPFDPRVAREGIERGFVRGPELVVAEVLDEQRSPLRPGDVLRAAGTKPLRVAGDLVRALLASDSAAGVISIDVERGGEGTTLGVPLQSKGGATSGERAAESSAPSALQIRNALGIVLEGYPLRVDPRARLGVTSAGATLDVPLPGGSYLLVLRREGFAETRCPVVIAGDGAACSVRLLASTDVPAGFIHVPAGHYTRGADPQAFQALPFERVDVPDFLIGRYEVTFDEYLEYLNDPASGVDTNGEVLPTQDAAKKRFLAVAAARKDANERISVLPRRSASEAVVERQPDARWSLVLGAVRSGRCPVFGVSRFAAEEYASWLTKRRATGAIAAYRLPADDEWEKAARGVDRRRFVWGDYPLVSFAWVFAGIPQREKYVEVVGYAPFDESVYGVRDMTGSVSEHALGRPLARYSFSSTRGGNWDSVDEYYSRAATRNGLLPWSFARGTGFRLVAELRAVEK